MLVAVQIAQMRETKDDSGPSGLGFEAGCAIRGQVLVEEDAFDLEEGGHRGSGVHAAQRSDVAGAESWASLEQGCNAADQRVDATRSDSVG